MNAEIVKKNWRACCYTLLLLLCVEPCNAENQTAQRRSFTYHRPTLTNAIVAQWNTQSIQMLRDDYGISDHDHRFNTTIDMVVCPKGDLYQFYFLSRGGTCGTCPAREVHSHP
jgi:hypothetical protein